MKFGFIFETEWNVGEDFVVTFESEDSLEKVMGIESPEIAENAVKILSKYGIKEYNLCGSFTEDHVEKLESIFGKEYSFKVAKYLPEEEKKLEASESLSNYGIILLEENTKDTVLKELNCPACDTTICFVRDQEAAIEAAKDLVEGGIDFIELCDYFDKVKTEGIIEAIDGAVPIGSAGELN